MCVCCIHEASGFAAAAPESDAWSELSSGSHSAKAPFFFFFAPAPPPFFFLLALSHPATHAAPAAGAGPGAAPHPHAAAAALPLSPHHRGHACELRVRISVCASASGIASQITNGSLLSVSGFFLRIEPISLALLRPLAPAPPHCMLFSTSLCVGDPDLDPDHAGACCCHSSVATSSISSSSRAMMPPPTLFPTWLLLLRLQHRRRRRALCLRL